MVVYPQSVVNRAKTFARVKAASAAITFYQKINLVNHEQTQPPAVCIVRRAATRRYGLNIKNRKETFEWEQVVKFAEAYGVRQHGYFLLVVAAMFVIMLGVMCRYDDVSGLMCRNICFEADGSAFEITFNKRNTSQFRQGNKVLAVAFPSALVCPVRQLHWLRIYAGGAERIYVFRGFNGRMVSKSPNNTAPGPNKIAYDQLLRYLGLWFSGVVGISVVVFRKQFATQSGWSGGASAAANVDVLKELWGKMVAGISEMRKSAT